MFVGKTRRPLTNAQIFDIENLLFTRGCFTTEQLKTGAIVKSYFRHSNQNILFMQCTIGPSGVSVPKGYLRKPRSGDIGLELRFARNKVEEFTPEQRVTAIRVAREMSDELLAALGDESEVEEWKPGTVVTATSGDREDIHGVIRRVTDNSIILTTISKKTGKLIQRELPRFHYALEEAEVLGGFEGIEGLVVFLFFEADGKMLGKIGESLMQYLSQERIESLVKSLISETEGNERNNAVGRVVLLCAALENQKLHADILDSFLKSCARDWLSHLSVTSYDIVRKHLRQFLAQEIVAGTSA